MFCIETNQRQPTTDRRQPNADKLIVLLINSKTRKLQYNRQQQVCVGSGHFQTLQTPTLLLFKSNNFIKSNQIQIQIIQIMKLNINMPSIDIFEATSKLQPSIDIFEATSKLQNLGTLSSFQTRKIKMV
jgi:hypothetical protein